MKTITAGIIAAALVGCFGCSTMPPKPESFAREDYSYTREYISWLIKREMKKNDVTGLSIALVDDRRIIWAEGFGWADEANAVPATPDTVYRVGSVSKLFTATAAMQLAEQGRFDIDKPLRALPAGICRQEPLCGRAPRHPAHPDDPPFRVAVRSPPGDVDEEPRAVRRRRGSTARGVCGQSPQHRLRLFESRGDPPGARRGKGRRRCLRLPYGRLPAAAAGDDPLLIFGGLRPVVLRIQGVSRRRARSRSRRSAISPPAV